MQTRTKTRKNLYRATASLLLFAPAHAWGQDIAAAEALFNKGVAELKAGNYDSACPAIAESQKLDPRPGTQFTLAECYARAGKAASAFVAFEDFLRTVRALPSAQQLRYADRVKAAESKKSELKEIIPELTIVAPSNAPSGMKITRDGIEITKPMMGVSIPVDPGEHTIIVEAPGKPPTEQKISLSPGERRTIEAPLPGTKQVKIETPPPPDDKPGHPGIGRTVGTIAAFGIGAAGLAVGAVGGSLALGDKKTVDKECNEFACNTLGLEAVDHGRMMARISTIGFAIGGVGIATGVVLLLTRPKPEKSTVSADVAVGHTGFAVTVKGVLP